MTRPPAPVAFGEMLTNGGEPEPALRVICGTCNRALGRAVRGHHGLLWLGYLRNPMARRLRDGEESIDPVWLDPQNFVRGECRCTVETGITEPGWPTLVSRSHQLAAADVLAHIAARRRVVEV